MVNNRVPHSIAVYMLCFSCYSTGDIFYMYVYFVVWLEMYIFTCVFLTRRNLWAFWLPASGCCTYWNIFLKVLQMHPVLLVIDEWTWEKLRKIDQPFAGEYRLAAPTGKANSRWTICQKTCRWQQMTLGLFRDSYFSPKKCPRAFQESKESSVSRDSKLFFCHIFAPSFHCPALCLKFFFFHMFS